MPDLPQTSWNGCGMHIESALAGVEIDQRCKCKVSPLTSCSESPLADYNAATQRWVCPVLYPAQASTQEEFNKSGAKGCNA